MDIEEVSLRHDPDALSPLFKCGIAHNWCRENPVTSDNLKVHGARMPSDADAVRMHVLSVAEESRYFQACLAPPQRITVRSKGHIQIRNGKRVQIGSYEYSRFHSSSEASRGGLESNLLRSGPRI